MNIDELLALPVAVDLQTAARAFGIGKNKAYELAKNDEFPVPLLRIGVNGYRIRRADLLNALGVTDAPPPQTELLPKEPHHDPDPSQATSTLDLVPIRGTEGPARPVLRTSA